LQEVYRLQRLGKGQAEWNELVGAVELRCVDDCVIEARGNFF
jgi:hypothetical protein